MAQLFFLDTGLLVHQGELASVYAALESYDPAIHGISEEDTVFDNDLTIGDPPDEQPNPNHWANFPWFYIPGLNAYFRNKDGIHAYLWGAKSVFDAIDPNRWEEIEDILDEHGDVNDMLDKFQISRVRRKFVRARNKDLITTAELQALRAIVEHL